MYAADVKGSIAFSKALLKAGIVDESEQKEITRGLKQVEQEWADGKVGPDDGKRRYADLLQFAIEADDEDIHTANERRLSEIVGKDIGGKLHTGRSRNDQVATDMRIWLVSCVLHHMSSPADPIDGRDQSGRGEPKSSLVSHGHSSRERSRCPDARIHSSPTSPTRSMVPSPPLARSIILERLVPSTSIVSPNLGPTPRISRLGR